VSRLRKLISGGQSGVDRAALDAARSAGLEIGGWCPAGRWAEDGPIPLEYPLDETPEAGPGQRTAWNVRDADATLILTRGQPGGGTAQTLECARAAGRPWLLVDLDTAAHAPAISAWLAGVRPGTLNVAGPRESQAPGIAEAVRGLLEALLASPDQP
jgi:hypothetical protein